MCSSDLIQPVVNVLPLTHMLRAMRALTVEQQSFLDQWPALLIMTAWVLGTLLLARWSFSYADA